MLAIIVCFLKQLGLLCPACSSKERYTDREVVSSTNHVIAVILGGFD
jgi:hypothetical protein